MAGGARICLGQIGAAHGVHGEVRLRSYTSDPRAIAGYGPLQTEDGRVFAIESLKPAGDHFVARFSGVRDREAARALANAKLYVPRERLPAPEAPDEFYHADLIGLAVLDPTGKQLGTIVAVHNFGAGDLIEVDRAAGGSTEMLPFNEMTVPVVDVAAGRIIVAAAEASFTSSPLAGGDKKAKPNRMRRRDGTQVATQPRAAVGSRRRRPTLSRKRRG
jgi:16S rRNA processing protein RimM